MLIVTLLVVLAGILVGYSIGANDAANCVGADVGSKDVTLFEGLVITSVFGLLGAVFFGSNVIKTVGRGIVPLDKLDPNIAMYIALSACFGAAVWVLVATYMRLPVSTSHAIVGAVAGAGLAVAAPIYWNKLGDIFIGWIITPFGAALFSIVLFIPLRFVFYELIPIKYRKAVIRWAIISTSAYLAFTWGANDVANATGVMVGVGIFPPMVAAIIGGAAIVVGIVTWGYKVIETVGFKIVKLASIMTITAEVASALNVHIYTLLGLPVSTSHSIVGAIIGVGLFRGVRSIDAKIMLNMVFAWALTPLLAGGISFAIMFLINFIRASII